MSRIRIKNFGPIHEGFTENDGWIDVKKVTVMIGDQGSGKSTVAKLISVFSWIEKNVVRQSISIDKIDTTVFKNLCALQELFEYFQQDTMLSFEGEVCDFEYNAKENIFKGKTNSIKLKNYVLPKIQYISAARNLLTLLYNISLQSIIDKEGKVFDMSSNIPYMVKDLNSEYMKALNELAKEGFSLPINETSVFFQNHNTFIKTRGNKVSMSAASSGIQSITPLLLVSYYLSEMVQKDISERLQTIDNNLRSKIENELAKESESLSEKFKQLFAFGKGVLKDDADMALLEEKLKKFIPSSFINIVEEPEQNLFPTSQQRVINCLLEFNNKVTDNKLIITTHSPYIIGYLTLAIKANELYHKAKTDEVKRRINEIVPMDSAVDHDNLAIYELDEKDGTISLLGSENDIPNDNDYLDTQLGLLNDLFSDLLDIEDLCR
ncbi:MAG: AAA family ATPase [Bacteroidales bacterium]|nr:AAA family ATPase [Bacteroidales bacterium]